MSVRRVIRNVLKEMYQEAETAQSILSKIQIAFDEIETGDIAVNDRPGNPWIDYIIFYNNASLDDVTYGLNALRDPEVLGDTFTVKDVKPNRVVLRIDRNVLSESKYNPWAVCTASVGRSDKDKYERCVKGVKKDQNMEEDATSKSQQRLFGQVHAIQTGAMSPEDLDPKYRDKIMKIAGSIKKKDAEDFATTKHKGLPNKVKKENFIQGGLADRHKEEDFDPEQLKKGIEVEMEHTDNPDIAKEIAMDHLTEFPDYYSALEKMEKNLENNKKLFIDKSLGVDDGYKDSVKKFIVFCCNDLNIDVPFKTFLRAKRGGPIKTTASYNTVNNDVNVYARGRGLVDVLRSIAHEIRHLRQNIDGELIEGSGDDGSTQENEAHAFSGLMIRRFGKANPEIYE